MHNPRARNTPTMAWLRVSPQSISSGDESGDRSDDFYSFTERGRTARECRRRVTCPWTTPEGCRLGIGCHREPSRVGSRSSYPAGSGLRRPGGVRELRLMN
ncbi:hypothetical protein EVAR_67809_1 [Eumeta japonica]|uniref:Uncharacterized protein n=1 Tax=Eumeta variegata TaxID=151549 RepID=A0A4C2A1Y9_EUMVA|nr:hypothetical protein EVAR_67809_1 [Eumeta japonica]